MNCINSNEIMNVKLTEKQTKVIAQIDYKLKSLLQARILNSPFTVGLDTDEQISTRTNELLDIRRQCDNLKTFGQVDSATLDIYRIDYKAD
jgi:hypothetical protein